MHSIFHGHHSITLSELNCARANLHNLLQAEEMHWEQKSRIKWLAEGNRNTKFFHLYAKLRGCHNTIDRIAIGNSSISDPALIKSALVQHFAFTFDAKRMHIHESLYSTVSTSGYLWIKMPIFLPC